MEINQIKAFHSQHLIVLKWSAFFAPIFKKGRCFPEKQCQNGKSFQRLFGWGLCLHLLPILCRKGQALSSWNVLLWTRTRGSNRTRAATKCTPI